MRVDIKHIVWMALTCLFAFSLQACASDSDTPPDETNNNLISINISGKVYYRTPTMDNAAVNDQDDQTDIVPIEGIEVMLVNSDTTVYTDVNGAYIIDLKEVNIGIDDVVVLTFTDVDGEENGGIFEQLVLVKDKIVWFDNKAVITLDAEMVHAGSGDIEDEGPVNA